MNYQQFSLKSDVSETLSSKQDPITSQQCNVVTNSVSLNSLHVHYFHYTHILNKVLAFFKHILLLTYTDACALIMWTCTYTISQFPLHSFNLYIRPSRVCCLIFILPSSSSLIVAQSTPIKFLYSSVPELACNGTPVS